MKIRTVKEEDYQELMQLFNLFVGEDRYSRYDADSFNKVIRNPQNTIFIAEDERQIIGFATMSVRDVIRFLRPIAELDEIFIKETHRRQGIAKELMEEVEKKARDIPCSRIFIGSFYERKEGHKLYEALGYTNKGYQYVKELK